MACGVPTIASGNSALGENLRDAAELIEINDPEELTSAMKRLLMDSQIREEFRTKGLARAAQFRWNATAEQIWNCYKELAEMGFRD
jgi:glycosyltransferase involved in cell wall biosynthesis